MRVIAPPPSSFDAPPSSPLILRDGSVAAVRAAGPADRAAVRRFFRALSPDARYHRFFSLAEPPDAIIDRLCAPADASRNLTLFAIREHSPDRNAGAEGAPQQGSGGAVPEEQLLGMATYLRTPGDAAEVAFAVDERFGYLGIATGLLERLAATAVGAGLTRFQANTLTDNNDMLRVFRDSGFMIRSKLDSDVVDVELSLTPSARNIAACEAREHTATVASMRPFLEPLSVAVIGVSRNPRNLGHRIFHVLRTGGYEGPVYAVNPHADEAAGVRTLHSMREAPHGIDLAVVAVPRDAVLSVVDDCAAAGVKSLVVISAGFAEVGADGQADQDQLLRAVRGHGMRMIGPNCMGLLNAHLRMNASLASQLPPAGRVAFSSQSGALGLAILALARDRGVGLSSFVSVGNKADVSSNDLLQYWEDDAQTSVILLYLESFGNPRRFARLARRIGLRKPIIALKSGRTRSGMRAAGSHTAALAASEAGVDALFRQAGVVRADTVDEMFDVAACLAQQPLPAGQRLAIISNGGGPGILAVDACTAAGLEVPEFSAATRGRLGEFLPSAASTMNPVDMIASAGPDEYRRAIEVALTAAEIDAVLVIYTPVDSERSPAIVTAIRDGIVAGRGASGGTRKPVLVCTMAEEIRPVPLTAGDECVPNFAFPENAIRALGKVVGYAAWRARPAGLFWSFDDIRADEARKLCREVASARGDAWLTPEELQRVTQAFGLPFIPGVLTHSAEEAAAIANVVGFPVAAKLISPQVLHKSDAGAIRLRLTTPAAVRQAFDELMEAARQQRLQQSVDGVLIQPMVLDGTETLVGVADDPLFGPLVGVGLGGTLVEVLSDVRFRIAPLTERDADDLIHEMRGFSLLDGYHGRPKADVAALSDVILRVSRLAEEVPEIVEMDLNPVMVLREGEGCRIVDARIRVLPR
jgi:acetyl coenzyme A synthetase (ADP forming)-like protein